LPYDPGNTWSGSLVLLALYDICKEHDTDALLSPEASVTVHPALLQMLHEPHLNGPYLDFAREQKYLPLLPSLIVNGCP
jgi:hypothetical protein